jgi:hypothetical protein
VGVDLGAGTSRRGLGIGVGLGGGLGDGGSTMGVASAMCVDTEGAGRLADGASAVVREALHPAAAVSRMARTAVAVRFVNEALLR